MNGAPLSVEHGAPARLVVPGYYGTNSVKWLSRLHLAGGRADSLFTTTLYNDPVPGSEATNPVWQVAPESAIVSPAPGDRLPGREVEIWGWAWSDGEVGAVEISTDGGNTWHPACLERRAQRSWQRFSYRWPIGRAGKYELHSRATDRAGETQPADGARNAVYAISVTIDE